MKKFTEIQSEQIKENTFQLIGQDWMLVTAEKDGVVNTMTAAWGGFGVMWGLDVAYVVIRPQRFTNEFVDGADSFSLTFFNSEYKKKLSYLGTVSGRDEDKIGKAGLTIVHEAGTPYFEEASMVLLCKKLYAQPMQENSFVGREIIERCYPGGDYHILYIGEIKKILKHIDS